MAVSVLLVFAYLVWGGFDWITSGGDKTKIENARNKLRDAIIGIIIVASSYAILTLLIQLLGFTSLQQVLENATGGSSTQSSSNASSLGEVSQESVDQ